MNTVTTTPAQDISPPIHPLQSPPAPNKIKLIQLTGWSYFPIAFIARLPFAMMIVGVLTLVVSVRGSIALGGMNSAMVGLGTAIFGPLLGAAADRFGQRPILLCAGIAHATALTGFALTVPSTASNQGLLLSAFLIGATAPQVAPMSRSRLVDIIKIKVPAPLQERMLAKTQSYESAADEVVFVFGPVVVGVLATAFNTAAPIYGAAALTAVSVLTFALHPSARLARRSAISTAVEAGLREVWRWRILRIVIGAFGMGLFFGMTLTGLTSFLRDQGDESSAGLIYGVMGVGSAIFALAMAYLPAKFKLSYRWLGFSAVMLLAMVIFGNTSSVSGIAIALMVAGIGVGPVLVTLFSLAAMRTPPGRSATVMTMVGAGLIVGQATAAISTGAVAENLGTAAALWLPLGATLLIMTTGVIDAMRSTQATDASDSLGAK